MKKHSLFILGSFFLTFIFSSCINNKVFDEIKGAKLTQIENLEFYKDGLRNDGGYLDIPITDEQDQQDFLDILQKIEPSGVSLKSLDVIMLYRVRFNLKVTDNRLITVNIYRGEQTGDKGIITIDEGDTFVRSIGTFESEDLLRWVENMKQKDEFNEIGGKY